MSSVEPISLSYEEIDSVVLQDLTACEGDTDGMDHVEQQWLQVASHSQLPRP